MTVRDGYGRNYLVPRQLAVIASLGNVRQVEHQQRLVETHRKKATAESMGLKARIEAVSVSITRAVGGEDSRMFGSVTARDIADAFATAGVPVDRKLIDLDEPIRLVGEHTVEVRLSQGVRATSRLTVVAKA